MKLGHFMALFIVPALALSCIAPTPKSTPTPMPTPAPKPTQMPAGILPLIDAHNHLPRGVTLDYLIKLMDESGVQMTVLMPVFYGGDNRQGQGISDENLVLDFYQKRPDRIIPFLGMQRPFLRDIRNWEEPDRVDGLLQFTESRLRTGLYRGMGEFILRHYPYTLPNGAKGKI